MATPYSPLEPNPFRFANSKDAALHNSAILEQHNYDLDATLSATAKGSHLECGSEFRPATQLEPLLKDHPLWHRTKCLLNDGCSIPLTPMDTTLAHQDLTLGIARGNHKGALAQQKLLHELVTKDVAHGFALPITTEAAKSIQGAAYAPLNIQEQWTIDAQGKKMKKKRLTHDQSFPGMASDISLNEQVVEEKLEPLIYGYMFLRMLHMIHAFRMAHPTTAILLCKFDLDAAYRRLHFNANSAIKCICSTAICAYIYLRLTFGGSFSPAEWCVIIEMMTDLANDIVNNPTWVPSKAQAPIPSPSTIPSPIILPASRAFNPALPVDVHIHIPRHGWVDSYIDDIIGICLHLKDNAVRTTKAILLAIHLMARPFDNTEKPNIIHSYILSMKKWLAEGQQSEEKIVLGWLINTRDFTVRLPADKYHSYTAQIRDITVAGQVNDDTLQSIIGRLERTSYVVPHARYFLNRLRALQRITSKTKWAKIPESTSLDLKLWHKFLDNAHKGTNINNLVFRRPSNFFWADSCPFGLGGYSSSGRAWRYYIPPSLRSVHTNNVLEYLAIIVTMWVDAIEGNILPLACCLACSDSTSAVGWLHRSNFDPCTRPIHEELSRHLAEIMMKVNSTVYSQHQTGKHNTIADLLSRWHFLTPSQISAFLQSRFNTQMPTNFNLCPLPKRISCWITSLLLRLKTSTALRTLPTTAAAEHGNDGSPGWQSWAGSETPSLHGLQMLKNPEWSGVLQSLYAEGNTVIADTQTHWSEAQSQRPSLTWLRPFRTTTNQTHATTQKVRHTPFSNLSSDHSENQIQERNPKKRSLQRSLPISTSKAKRVSFSM